MVRKILGRKVPAACENPSYNNNSYHLLSVFLYSWHYTGLFIYDFISSLQWPSPVRCELKYLVQVYTGDKW